MALLRPIGDWPLVLCGPMLRRVAPESVSVFVALKQAGTVAVQVRRLGASAWAAQGPPCATVALGTNLHVVVAQVSLGTHLETGCIYEYDLAVATGSASHNLASAGLLSGEWGIGYADGWLPSFALAPGLRDLKLVHASCRLAHGDGWDMLALLDGMIFANLAEPRQRPHQLVLSGDQIYADDVAPCLIAMLTATGRSLLGWDVPELLPYGDGTQFVSFAENPGAHRACPPPGAPRARFKQDRTKQGSTPASRMMSKDFLTRAELVYGQGDLTSSAADCHLLFLGEYYAMYLFAWSDALWPREGTDLTAPSADEAIPALADPLALDSGEMWAFLKDQADCRRKAAHSRDKLLRYAETVPRVRRALANVPVAMIFDDHEVTDDWFINGQWYRHNLTNPLSRRLIRNGLLAYGVFQDWGNQPEDYAVGRKGWDLLNAVRWNSSGAPPLGQVPDLADTLLGLPPPDAMDQAVAADQRKRWDHVQSGPDFQLAFLDARNWRRFHRDDAARERAAAELIDAPALAQQLGAGRLDPDKLLILVAGTPVLGAKRIEEAQGVIARRLKMPELGDFEAWAANDTGLANLLRSLLAFGRVVVLSGDVHYGFANNGSFVNSQSGARARVVQLCASALKNHSDLPLAAELISSEADDTGWRGAVGPADAAWRTTLLDQLVAHYDAQLEQARQRGAPPSELDELLRRRFRLRQARLLGSAWVLPDSPLAADRAALALTRSLLATAGVAWDFRVDGIQPTLERYSLDGLRMQPGGLRGVDGEDQRYCIGHNNLGVVTFGVAADGSLASVTQLLYFDDRQGKHERPGRSPAGIDVLDVLRVTVPLTPPTAAEM